MIAYESDDSSETQATIQKLKVSLEEARENLEQSEYDKYLEDSEKMLDDLYSSTEEWINTRLDNIDALINEIIAETNENAETINETIEGVADEVGYVISGEMESIWDTDSGIGKIVSEYSENFSSYSTNVQAALQTIIESITKMVEANPEETLDESITTPTTPPSTGGSGNTGGSAGSGTGSTGNTGGNKGSGGSSGSEKSDREAWAKKIGFIYKKSYYPKDKLNKDVSIVDRLAYYDFDPSFKACAAYYKAMGGTDTYKGTAKQNTWMIAQMKANGYKKGSRRIPEDQLAWTQENGQELIYRSSDGAMLTPLGAGDAVFTSEMTQRLWEIAQNPSMFNGLATTTIPKGIISNGTNNDIKNDVEFNISMYGVQDVNGLVNELKSNKGFEKLVQTVTLGNALGNNSLNKYRH